MTDENSSSETAQEELKSIAKRYCENDDELGMLDSFVDTWLFIDEFPQSFSWRGKQKPDIHTSNGKKTLAERYFSSYRRSDFPAEPSTVADEMVSVIMQNAYGYTSDECQRIKIEHQRSMCAENCVGNLLERYLNSKIMRNGWSWCCGEYIRAIDFLRKNEDDSWTAIQIKNRNNSENSSSSAIREGTSIEKWFRSFSKDTIKGRSSLTNWSNLPPQMKGYGLSENEFKAFVTAYIRAEKLKTNHS